MKRTIFFCISIFVVTSNFSSAYDSEVAHKVINEEISKKSGDFINKLALIGYANGAMSVVNGKQIYAWFRNGGEYEDAAPRWVNHFHDPTKAWNFAGLKEENVSSALWAQQEFQDAFNTWSWPQARTYYLEGLTATEPALREKSLSKSFRALGQVLHLLADAAVPAHTRDDLHPLGEPYELYCKNNIHKINLSAPSIGLTITTRSFVPGLAPISNIWDTTPDAGENSNPDGLAEYTNRNFLSTDTIFKGYPYPALAGSDVLPIWLEESTYNGSPDYRLYLSGWTTDGIMIDHLADTGYFWSELIKADPSAIDDARYKLDDKCYQEYAAILVPKAVGHGTALLDYFFRGQLELSLPARGSYAIATPDSGGFDNIRIKARNITPNSEALSSGTVELVVKYKTAVEDPFQGVPVPVSAEFSYIVVPEANGVSSIPSDSSIELVFNLGEQKIPLWATDLTVQVVYHGQMGFQTPTGFAGETNGVAVGLKDISEPTPIDYMNSMDVVCVNDQILPAGSDAAINTLDVNNRSIAEYIDVYPHVLANSYLKHAPQNLISYASATNYDASIGLLAAGHYARHFILTEPFGTPVLLNNQVLLARLDSRDPYTHRTKSYTLSLQGMINQVVYKDGVKTRYVSGMKDTRGIKLWTGINWVNMKYPANSTCNEATTSIPLIGPEAMSLQP